MIEGPKFFVAFHDGTTGNLPNQANDERTRTNTV